MKVACVNVGDREVKHNKKCPLKRNETTQQMTKSHSGIQGSFVEVFLMW